MRLLSSALLCLFAAFSLAVPLTESPQANEGTTDAATPETKMCSCDVADNCRKESMDGMDDCMKECEPDHLKGYEHEFYFPNLLYLCFVENNATIVEAENCLFESKTDYCAANNETKYINKTNWDDLTSFNYTSTADKSIINNTLWKRHEPKYNKIQSFLHCTKHCIHKKLQTCSEMKGCAVKMPTRDEFAEKMKTCTKKNTKISTAIFETCQCLAWTINVKELRGSCVVIGNSYYIDRA